MTATPISLARASIEALSTWERNFLRVNRTGDFGMLRRELGGLRDRPASDKHYGEIRYEDDAERIEAAIREKIRQAQAGIPEEVPIVATSKPPARREPRGEAQQHADWRRNEVLDWLRDEGPATIAEVMARFQSGNTIARADLERLERDGDVRRTGTERTGPKGGRPSPEYAAVEVHDSQEWKPGDPVPDGWVVVNCPGEAHDEPCEFLIPELLKGDEACPDCLRPVSSTFGDDEREPHTPPHLLGAAGDVVDHDGEPPSIAERIADRYDRGLTIPRPGEGLERGDDGVVIEPDEATIDAERPVWVVAAEKEAEALEGRVSPLDLVPDEPSGDDFEAWQRTVCELAGHVKTLDECRQHLAGEVRTLREEVGVLSSERAELREAVADLRLEVAALADGISVLGDRLTRYAGEVEGVRAATGEAIEGLERDVVDAVARAEAAVAQMDASGADALDVTLGAAVAGLARIGRGELDPRRLVEALRGDE